MRISPLLSGLSLSVGPFLSSLLPSPFLLCGEEFQAAGPHNRPAICIWKQLRGSGWGGKKAGRENHKTLKPVPSRLQNFNQHMCLCGTYFPLASPLYADLLCSSLWFYSWILFCLELFCLTVFSLSMITDMVIFSAPRYDTCLQPVQTLMVISPAPFTLLSGIKSINLKIFFAVLRS